MSEVENCMHTQEICGRVQSPIYTKYHEPYFKIIKLGTSQNVIILRKLPSCGIICTYTTINVQHTEISVFNVKKLYLHTCLLLCSIRQGTVTTATHPLQTTWVKLDICIFFTIHKNQQNFLRLAARSCGWIMTKKRWFTHHSTTSQWCWSEKLLLKLIYVESSQ